MTIVNPDTTQLPNLDDTIPCKATHCDQTADHQIGIGHNGARHDCTRTTPIEYCATHTQVLLERARRLVGIGQPRGLFRRRTPVLCGWCHQRITRVEQIVVYIRNI